jgi:formylglycine-generating enzyme required for sulfatase activity
MAQSEHTGRACTHFTQTGLVAGFLATAGVLAVTQSVCADGNVRAWGYNGFGETIVPADLGPCAAVAAGVYHTVALRSDGNVRAWGYNGYGQTNVPTDLGIGSAVAAGRTHTVAIRIDGNVRAWGENNYGQTDVPTDLGPCAAVAAGYYHTVAIRIDGNVRAWGLNNWNQNTVPADLGTCAAVAAGDLHTVALRSDGNVRAWGNNGNGQNNVPADLGPCSAVATGAGHTVALRSDGNVRAWGYNGYGQTNVPADLGICSAVAAGYLHTVALRSDGNIRAWGANNRGQTNVPADLGPCAAVAASDYHTVAIAGPPALDTDGDGRPDSIDNCPAIANPTQADCNSDGVGDACEIAAGTPDVNHDAIPDTCQCIADLFFDNQVNGADLGILLGQWGQMGSADLDGNGVVNGADLGIMLGAWGQCSVTLPTWATVVEAQPDPAVVTDATLRAAISASGRAWRVRDNGTNIEMLLVPPGTFTMGCTASNQYGCDSDENPTHSVTLTQAFYMGRYEVTQSQWVAKMGSNPSYFQGQPDSASRPVERVSWDTIQGYLYVTSMRLPSEAEWEYACRAGTTTAFNNGSSDVATVGDIAWYNGNSGNQTHAVGGKAANALGLHDMSGNVYEWVNDLMGSYSSEAQTNPLGPVSGSSRVWRGGSWYTDAYYVRSSNRYNYPPDYTNNGLGFRVARAP